MTVASAGEDIRCGQTHVREPAAIRAAANRFFDGFKSHRAVSLEGNLNDFRTRLNHFAHVEVLVADLELKRARSISVVNKVSSLLHFLLEVLEFGFVVVADDVSKMRAFRLTRHLGQVNETFSLFSVLCTVKNGQQVVKIDCHLDGALKLSLGCAGMHAAPVYLDLRAGRVKVLI